MYNFLGSENNNKRSESEVPSFLAELSCYIQTAAYISATCLLAFSYNNNY